MVDIELIFRNHAAIRGPGHGRKHSGETRVAAKDFNDHETLVGTSGSAETVDHLNRACDAGAETDAIVSAGGGVVHGLGNANDFEPFLVKANAIAQRVVAADGDERVDAEPSEIFEHLRGEVVLISGEFVFEMRGDAGLGYAARDGTSSVLHSAASTAGE